MTRICGKQVSRNKIVAAVISQLSNTLDEFGQWGFAAFRDQWLTYDEFAGRLIIDAIILDCFFLITTVPQPA